MIGTLREILSWGKRDHDEYHFLFLLESGSRHRVVWSIIRMGTRGVMSCIIIREVCMIVNLETQNQGEDSQNFGGKKCHCMLDIWGLLT